MEENRLIIYGSENCFKCKQRVRELTEQKTQFEYIDIETLLPEQIDKLSEEHGTSLPIEVEVKDDRN